MVCNSGLTDKQSLSYLPVLESFGNERNDLSLSLSQRLDLGQLGIDLFLISNRHLPEHASHRRPVKPDFSCMDLFDRFNKHIRRVLFQHHAHGTELDRLAVCICISETGQDQDLSVGCCLT